MRRTSSALLLCSLIVACKDSEQQAGPMPQPSKTAPKGFEFDTAQAIATKVADPPSTTGTMAKAGTTTASLPILPPELVLQLKATLPAIDNARVLEDLQGVAQSRMARLVICVELGVEPATSQIIRAYRKASWKEITVHTPPHDENRRSFTGVSDSFRLSGSAYQGAFKDCEKTSNFTRVSFSFHEREDDSKTLTPDAQTTRPKAPATLASPRTLDREARIKDAKATGAQ